MLDLFFAGSDNPVWQKHLIDNNCNRLASWVNDKKVITDWIEKGATGKLFIDSGAYSAHSVGKEVDVDKYIELLNELDDHVYIAAQVDKIPGVFRQPKTRKQLLEAPYESWQNYLYMREKVKSPDKILPIFHQGEDFDWLVRMLETKFDGKHIPYIGISPANDVATTEKNRWFKSVFKIIAESSNPKVKTHAFGMTSLPMLERYPFTSADSTSFIMTGANGLIMTKFGNIVMSEKQSDAALFYKHYFASNEEESEFYKYIEKMGYNVATLETDYAERVKFNISYLLDWLSSYEFKGTQRYAKPLVPMQPKTLEQHLEIIRKADEMEQTKQEHDELCHATAKANKTPLADILDSVNNDPVVEEMPEEEYQHLQKTRTAFTEDPVRQQHFGTVKGLGQSGTTYTDDYNPDLLEYFENVHQGNDYVVKFQTNEFTSKCPKTGQPDFANILIRYIPNVKMVESKSLKLYLFSFRNHGDFHEDCINKIMKDLVNLMDPKYLEVKGLFTPRGGISIYPFANYSNGEEKFNKLQEQRNLAELGGGFND